MNPFDGFSMSSDPAPPGRSFSDAPATREAIYSRVRDSVANAAPVKTQKYTLTFHNVDYDDEDVSDAASRKRALLTGGTLMRRLRGTLRMTDNVSGQPIGERHMTIAKVPVLTDSGTFVLNGVNYSLANQSRLIPGAYIRRTEAGDIEGYVNPTAGKGTQHRYTLDPGSGVFKLKVGQSFTPLLPVLKALGAEDKDLEAAWGPEILAANQKAGTKANLGKLAERLRGRPLPPGTDPVAALREMLPNMPVSPDTTQRTLGQSFTGVTPELILAATKKVLAVQKGEAEPDDRDAPVYQRVLGPEDLFAERAGQILKGLQPYLWKLNHKGDINIVPPNFHGDNILSAILKSGLGQTLEEPNPLDLLGQMTRISRLGYGGIPSVESVPLDSRMVMPTQFGYVDSIYSPESDRIGVDARLAASAWKGNDGKIYTPILDITNRKKLWASPDMLADKVVAFPGELDDPTNDYVRVVRNGRLSYAPRREVTHAYPDADGAFNPVTQLVPGKSGSKAQRASMAARMLTQALPLINPEAPFVQAGMPNQDRSFEEHYGMQVGAVRASAPGRVESVEEGKIVVRQADGKKKTYNLQVNSPQNRKTRVHNTPTVQVGDRIAADQLLAHSNFTDKNGTAALGANLRVAYIPYRGLSYEDALVVSQSAANKLTSEHLYQHDVDLGDDVRKGKSAYVSLFPSTYKREILETLDEDGVVRPGTEVNKGDPLVLKARSVERGHQRVARGKHAGFSDVSETWDHDDQGIVTDVARTKNGVNVVVIAKSRFKDSDKLSGRIGDKGIVSRIIPDDEMPHDRNGRPFDILVNPLTVITRLNPIQLAEAALGKIVERTGKPYKLRDFDTTRSFTQYALDELKKNNVEEKEEVVDPITGRVIPNVFTGNRYFLKLHHQGESKLQGRGLGAYTSDDSPAKTGGSEGSSKRVALMDVAALMSHGAYNLLRDVKEIRSQRNSDYWAELMAGGNPKPPRTSSHHEKFIAQLKAAGLNVVRNGPRLKLMALTDKDVDAQAGEREITSPETVDFVRGMKPIPGGLFDPGLTGSHAGTQWARVTLNEPMPNPAFEEPIRRVLGLTGPKFREIMSGKAELNGATGPKAIQKALSVIDLDKEIPAAESAWRRAARSNKDTLVKRWSALEHARRQGLHPSDWIVSKVPILPPKFRPVTKMAESGLPLIADPNYLYGDLIKINNGMKDLRQHTDNVGEETLALYDAFKAVTGLGDPVTPKNREKNVKGLLKSVFGPGTPKRSSIQYKLLGSTVDTVGRGVIIPDPDLNMDEVGLPEERAWTTYEPWVIRRLVRRGIPGPKAKQMVEDKNPQARSALIDEMEARPVTLVRAPTLHRYGNMAFYPKLVSGSAIRLTPIVTKGFGADFDGDQMNWHVSASDGAIADAEERMLPSRNLLSTKTFRPHYIPSNEFAGGLYQASADRSNNPVRTFRTMRDMIAAWQRGDISHSDVVSVLEGHKDHDED